MKYFSFFLLLVVFLVFSFLSVSSAEQSKSIDIESISHNLEPDNRESITFKLSGYRVPSIFLLKVDKPRLVVDFPDVSYKGKNVIPINNGLLAVAIRTGAHTSPVKKTRVVIDLSGEYEIEYKQISFDRENRLTLILFSTDSEKIEKRSEIVPISAEKEILVGKPETEKRVPPVPSSNDQPREGEVKLTESGKMDGRPRLLEISFDDSSNKGEMIIFRLNDFYPPEVSAIEKDSPRILCDFINMHLGVDVIEVINANGKYVERISTTLHKNPEKVRVVLDLSSGRDYDLQQVFFKNDNLFVLIVNEILSEEVKN